MVGQFGDDGLEAGHVPPEYACTRDSAGDVEGLNNKVRVVTRRSHGFRTYEVLQNCPLLHAGRLAERESAD